MCTLLKPPDINPTAVNKYIIYHTMWHIPQVVVSPTVRPFGKGLISTHKL